MKKDSLPESLTKNLKEVKAVAESLENFQRRVSKIFSPNSSVMKVLNTQQKMPQGLGRAMKPAIDILKKQEEQNKNLIKPIASFLQHSPYLQTLKEQQENSRKLMESMSPFFELGEKVKRLSSIKVKPLPMAKLLENPNQLHNFNENYQEQASLPPFITQNDLYKDELLKIREEDGVSNLEACHKFLLIERNLDKLISSWGKDPVFYERKNIFSQAIEAHRKEKYVLSIPTLLPQIEFIALDSLNPEKPTSKKTFNKERKLNFKSKLKELGKSNFPSTRLLFINCFLLEELFSNEENKPKVINRHEVLHGKNRDYYNITKYPHGSLKCIILLDDLFYLRKKKKELELELEL